MKSNLELQKDVKFAIKRDPLIYGNEIDVRAKNGIVILSGVVEKYSNKIDLARTVNKVEGVKSIVEDFIIAPGNSINPNDKNISSKILNTWENHWEVPSDNIRLKVDKGRVVLEGDVAWEFQVGATEEAIKYISGIKSVTNFVQYKPQLRDRLEKRKIESALKLDWSIDSKNVKVEVNKNIVKLTGIVNSLDQKSKAGRLAKNAPGVGSVENELAVIY